MGNALCEENNNNNFPNGEKEKLTICGSNNAAESNENILNIIFSTKNRVDKNALFGIRWLSLVIGSLNPIGVKALVVYCEPQGHRPGL